MDEPTVGIPLSLAQEIADLGRKLVPYLVAAPEASDPAVERASAFLEQVSGLLSFDDFLPRQTGEVVELREHQEDALLALQKMRDEGKTIALLEHATGAGKTTVMAMIIAWQTINAIRKPGSSNFTRGFLVVTPGLTIRDRRYKARRRRNARAATPAAIKISD